MNSLVRHQLLHYFAVAVFTAFGVAGYGLHSLPGLSHWCHGHCCEVPTRTVYQFYGNRFDLPQSDTIRRCNQKMATRCKQCELLASFRSQEPQQVLSHGRLLASFQFQSRFKGISLLRPMHRLPPSRGPPPAA